MAESAVQVSPDSTGKKIRTLEVTAVQPDGTTAVVEMQVVAIADPNGGIVDLDASQETIASLLRTQNALLRAMCFQLSFLNVPRVMIEDLTPFMQDAMPGSLA